MHLQELLERLGYPGNKMLPYRDVLRYFWDRSRHSITHQVMTDKSKRYLNCAICYVLDYAIQVQILEVYNSVVSRFCNYIFAIHQNFCASSLPCAAAYVTSQIVEYTPSTLYGDIHEGVMHCIATLCVEYPCFKQHLVKSLRLMHQNCLQVYLNLLM